MYTLLLLFPLLLLPILLLQQQTLHLRTLTQIRGRMNDFDNTLKFLARKAEVRCGCPTIFIFVA